MNTEQATVIIQEAKSRKVFPEALPEDSDKRIEMATSIVDQAYHAQRALGMENEHVLAIITLYESFTDAEGTTWNPSSSLDSSSPDSSSEVDADDPVEVEDEPESQPLTTAFIAKERAIALIRKERLPIAPGLDAEPQPLPRDLTTLTDLQFRKLHSEYTAVLARANYLVAMEAADEYVAKNVADKLYARVLAGLDRSGGKKVIAQLEAEAADDPEVVEWRERYHHHHVQRTILQALRDGYKETVDRLSRDWSMRNDERNAV